ncbi:MAG: hypothetical protein BVN34_02775 [Proteobacteria bacterium ST_bin12]|nr:MAG: hypothetical protein BVN34_02775 [Proteobacteria bacterium ST_bin12]
MQIDWQNFTPISALAGGALIGFAVLILYAFNGRYAGISGILSKLLNPQNEGNSWRLLFVLGLLLSPILWRLFFAEINISINTSPLKLGISGLLVGIGTACASGCTSGHGLIGLSRGSKRSIYAVLTFMSLAFVSHYLTTYIFQF